ncbi:unnamed protein product [Prunus brigantina]
MMRDLPNIKEIHDVCEGCQLGKQHRQAFPSGKAWRAKALLELVHTDVCGPMRTPSLDNNSSQSKGYRIYNPKTKKFMISRDVEFDEPASWNWEKEKVERKSVNITQPCKEETEKTPGTIPQPTTPPAIQHEGLPEPEQRTRSLQDIYETCNFITIEPKSFEVAVKEEIWRKAMEEEIKTIEKNKTWELVDRLKDKEIIGVKWVYKTKFNPDGLIQKHKARLVAKGYSQQPGIDYNETFAPVARLDTIRALVALAAQKKWRIYQLDVKFAFLNGELEEEIYVEQPQGYIEQGGEDKALKQKKALYRLKQAPRAWNSRIDTYFINTGFRRSKSEPTLYTKTQGKSDILIVPLYVDDLIYTGNNEEIIKEFKKDMMKTFEMSGPRVDALFFGH